MMTTNPTADDPILIARKHFDQALIYYESGNFDQALDSYNKAMQIAPQFIEHFNNDELKQLVESFSRLFFATIGENAGLRQDLLRIKNFQRQFLINVSNELRTHLNVVVENSTALLRETDSLLNNTQRHKLTTIQEFSKELRAISGDLLDNLNDPLFCEYFAIAPYIEGLKSFAEKMVEDKPIKILCHIDADLPDVCTDPMRIKWMLSRLVSNVAQFTQEGTISISVFRREREIAPMVQISVANTGLIIPLEPQPFYQRDYKIKLPSWDLINAKAFIERQGGMIWIDDPPAGFSAMFSLTIPTRNPNENQT
jgi:two-component system sensor histidine kinase BarA